MDAVLGIFPLCHVDLIVVVIVSSNLNQTVQTIASMLFVVKVALEL